MVHLALPLSELYPSPNMAQYTPLSSHKLTRVKPKPPSLSRESDGVSVGIYVLIELSSQAYMYAVGSYRTNSLRVCLSPAGYRDTLDTATYSWCDTRSGGTNNANSQKMNTPETIDLVSRQRVNTCEHTNTTNTNHLPVQPSHAEL